MEKCQDWKELSQFVKLFVESLDDAQMLKIDTQKLQNCFQRLKPVDLKYLDAVSAKTEVNEETIFKDYRCKYIDDYFTLNSIYTYGETECSCS